MEGDPPLSSLTGGGLHFAFLARAARMLQTASGDDPKIAQNSNTSKNVSGRPRITPRRLQDGQDVQTDPNSAHKTIPNKPPNRRNIKVNCDMMIVQKTQCKTHIVDIHNIVFRPFQRLRIDQIVSMSQRRTRTAPTTRFGALLGPLVPLYNRNVNHLGPQERPEI